MDISGTVIPKSDQLNSDDLIPGPRTITVTRVTANESSAEQPINIYFKGDDNKPFRPCKSMRRVLIAVWGADASQYAGRSMTLFRDPSVTWGGMEVGGIRISHMSHMDREMVMALTATKKARKPYRVLPLKVTAPPADAGDRVTAAVAALIDRINATTDMTSLEMLTADPKVSQQREWLSANRRPAADQVNVAIRAKLDEFTAGPSDGFPGDAP